MTSQPTPSTNEDRKMWLKRWKKSLQELIYFLFNHYIMEDKNHQNKPQYITLTSGHFSVRLFSSESGPVKSKQGLKATMAGSQSVFTQHLTLHSQANSKVHCT